MPVVIPVAVAAVAIGASFVAEGLTAFAIIAAIGATISAVGAVTGSKELTIAGGVIGAIGGIGGLASSAGLIGDIGIGVAEAGTGAGEGLSSLATSNMAENFSSAAGDVASGASNVSDVGNSIMTGAPTVATDAGTFAGGTGGTTDIIQGVVGNVATPGADTSATTTATVADSNPLQGVAENVTSPNVTPAAASDTSTSLLNQPGTDSSAGVPNTQMAGQETVDANGNVVQGDAGKVKTGIDPAGDLNRSVSPTTNITPASTTTAATNPPPISTPTGVAEGTTAAETASPFKGGGDSIFDKILGLVGKPGVSTLTAGILQAGGAFLAGATNQLTPAQIKALEAQAQANVASSNLANQQAEMIARQNSNMSQPIPNAVRTAGNPAPLTQKPPTLGLINQPPPVSAPSAPRVTGAPA